MTYSSEGTQSSTIWRGWWEEAKALFLFIILLLCFPSFLYSVSHQVSVI